MAKESKQNALQLEIESSFEQDVSESLDSSSVLRRKSTVMGVLMMIGSGLIFSIHAAMLQVGKSFGYESLQLLILRGLTQVGIAILSCLINIERNEENKQSEMQLQANQYHELNRWKPNFFSNYFCKYTIVCKYRILLLELSLMTKKLWFFVALRGIMGGLGATCTVYTITVLPLGDAIVIISLYPILTAFTAKLFLKEKITITHCIALFISIIGVILIAQPTRIFNRKTSNNDDNNGNINWFMCYSVGLMSSCLGSFAFVIIRLARKANATLLVISHGFFTIVEGSIILIIFSNAFNPPLQSFNMNGLFISPNILMYLLFIGLGIFGFLGQYTQNKAGQLIPAGIGSLLRSTDIVLSYIWQILFFNTMPNWLTITGAIIVLVAIFLVSYEKLKHLPNECQINSCFIIGSSNTHTSATKLKKKIKSTIKILKANAKNSTAKVKYDIIGSSPMDSIMSLSSSAEGI